MIATMRLVTCPYRPALRLCWKAIRLSSKLYKDGSQLSFFFGPASFLGMTVLHNMQVKTHVDSQDNPQGFGYSSA